MGLGSANGYTNGRTLDSQPCPHLIAKICRSGTLAAMCRLWQALVEHLILQMDLTKLDSPHN